MFLGDGNPVDHDRFTLFTHPSNCRTGFRRFTRASAIIDIYEPRNVASTEHHPPNAKSPRVSQIKRTCRPAASIVYNLGRSGKSSVIINAISNRFQSRPCAESVINTGVELILCKSLRPRKF